VLIISFGNDIEKMIWYLQKKNIGRKAKGVEKKRERRVCMHCWHKYDMTKIKEGRKTTRQLA
jgi:hypothetical protein